MDDQTKVRPLIDHNGRETEYTTCSIQKYWMLIEICHHQDVIDFDAVQPQLRVDQRLRGRTENIVGFMCFSGN